MPLILFDPLRECARMFLATIILEVNTLEQQDRICYHQNICNNRIEQQDRICYHQNICNNRIDAIGLTISPFLMMTNFDTKIFKLITEMNIAR